MKIYASRNNNRNPLEKYIGKDIWVKCTAPYYRPHDEILIKCIAPAPNYRGQKQAWMITIPYANYELALQGFTSQVDFVLTSIENSYKDPTDISIPRVVPFPIDNFAIKEPLEVYTSEELQEAVNLALDESYDSTELPFDI